MWRNFHLKPRFCQGILATRSKYRQRQMATNRKAYGLSLPPNVRADVVRVTQAFIFFESFERKGRALSEGKGDIRSPRKGCHSVFQ